MNKSAMSNTKEVVLNPSKIKFFERKQIKDNAGPHIRVNLKTIDKKVTGSKISEEVLERTM
jgi:hypothetical protein